MERIDKFIEVLGMRVDMVQIPDVLGIICGWIKNYTKTHYVVAANVDSAVWNKKDSKFRLAVNNSDLSVPDGMMLVLLGKFYGHNLKRRVYGPELMEDVCKLTAGWGYVNFFYGGANGVPEKMAENLSQKFPGLKISGTYSPSFRQLNETEDNQIVELINKAKPDVLWVGLGCPKQEIWMYEHKDRLNVPVMVGVGAAFDFYAGTKRQAPRWMREHGLEWFFRLVTEPRRLWKRYIVGGAVFLYNILLELVKYQFYKGNNSK